MNDCSIRGVQSFIKNFVQEIFLQVFAIRKLFNYGNIFHLGDTPACTGKCGKLQTCFVSV